MILSVLDRVYIEFLLIFLTLQTVYCNCNYSVKFLILLFLKCSLMPKFWGME